MITNQLFIQVIGIKTRKMFKSSLTNLVWIWLLSLSSVSFAQSKQLVLPMKGHKPLILNLEKKGIAIIGHNWGNKGAPIMRIDTSGNLVWSEEVQWRLDSDLDYLAVSSYNGNDIYLITSSRTNRSISNTSGANPKIFHIDSESGKMRQATSTNSNFGNILSLWANDSFCYVITTPKPFVQYRYEDGVSFELWRIDKRTLEFTKMDHDMEQPVPQSLNYWQVIRVESNFYEAYAIIEGTDKALTARLARFDNRGKLLRTQDKRIVLNNTFTRATNSSMPLAPGTSRNRNDRPNYMTWISDKTGESTILIVAPTAMCYMTYHSPSDSYFVYGYIGPKPQTPSHTLHTGFFVGKLDSSFNLIKFIEHENIPEVVANSTIHLHATPHSRMIAAYTSGPNLLIELGEPKIQFDISYSDLSILNTHVVEKSGYDRIGSKAASAGKQFNNCPKKVLPENRQAKIHIQVATTNRHYMIIYAISSKGTITITSESL